ncbi:branched-chain amino acid ABC transporter permease [Rhodococcus sp. AG1013]|uniref:branched-chain amino acid ABC transporter permease n=1 Tax=unclassified Rhodococcus (in: high G+C Gram-positive bacteria) TaxID=192944 RepID=UPI000E0B1D4C|nr:branched-chain amino acid ABC transporter permease [Rhodococcus sp. AG1013]RDI24807.1 amino acid/amide ABC transporter membrane protein 1 (HAAT family) [Rhodococcus sp. AG1013]
MSLFLQLGFQGIALGMVYGLIALGFVIMFKGSHTFNFAHGEIVALGAYSVLALMAFMPWGLAFVIAAVIVVVLGVLIEAVFLRRMVGKSVTTVVLATLGISIMLHQAILMIWGVGTHGSAGPVGSGTVNVGSVVLPWSGIVTIGTSVVVLAGLAYFFQKTPYGLALRATASHQEAALAQGIDVRRMFALSWGLAAFLAVVAGVFLASFPRVVSPSLGIVALLAIPAIVIGGMDSLVGAIVGGLIVGLIQVMGSYYLSDIGGGRLHEVLPYIVMFAVLVVRPYGLFGSKSVERV